MPILKKFNIEIISSGGTFEKIKALNSRKYKLLLGCSFLAVILSTSRTAWVVTFIVLIIYSIYKKGLNITFSRVAMRPGKPLIFGQIHGKPMLGLPGNPVSAGVTALLFLKPAIDLMLGRPNQNEPKETAVLGLDLESNDRRQDYLRSTLVREINGELHVIPFEKQDSSMLANFTDADCLVVRKPFAQAALKGERVPIIRLDPNA